MSLTPSRHVFLQWHTKPPSVGIKPFQSIIQMQVEINGELNKLNVSWNDLVNHLEQDAELRVQVKQKTKSYWATPFACGSLDEMKNIEARHVSGDLNAGVKSIKRLQRDNSSILVDKVSTSSVNNSDQVEIIPDCYQCHLEKWFNILGRYGVESPPPIPIEIPTAAPTLPTDRYVNNKLSQTSPVKRDNFCISRTELEAKRREKAKLARESRDYNVYDRFMPPKYIIYTGRSSFLTQIEQSRYLAMLIQLQNHDKLKFSNNKNDFTETSQLIKPEHEEFNKFVYDNACSKSRNLMPYTATNTNRIRCITERMQAQNERLTRIPVKYISHAEWFTDHDQQLSNPIVLNFVKNVGQVGRASQVVLLSLDRKTMLSKTDAIAKRFPIQAKLNKKMLSEDPNIDTVLQQDDLVRVFASSSSLAKLLVFFGNGSTESYWDIPVTVKTTFVSGRRRKIVTLAQPLKAKWLSQIELNRMYFTLAFKTSIIKPNFDVTKPKKDIPATTPTNIDSSIPKHEKPSVSQTDCSSEKEAGECDEEDEEIILRDGPSSSNVNVVSDLTKSKIIDSDSEAEAVDVENIEENTVTTVVDGVGDQSPQVRETIEINKNECDNVLDVFECLGMTSSVDSTSIKPIISNKVDQRNSAIKCTNNLINLDESSRYDYNVWMLGDLFLAIRAKFDGDMKRKQRWLPPDKKKNQRIREQIFEENKTRSDHCRVSISAKTEYQAGHGGEVFSTEEKLFNLYRAIFVRAELCVIGHIEQYSDEILAITELKTEQLLSELSEEFAKGCSSVSQLLNALLEYDEGSYLIRYDGTNVNLKIYRDNESDIYDDNNEADQSCVSLINDLVNVTRLKVAPKVETFDQLWRPIDPKIIFQWHRINKRVPATFPWRNENQPPNIYGKELTGKKKKRNYFSNKKTNRRNDNNVSQQELEPTPKKQRNEELDNNSLID